MKGLLVAAVLGFVMVGCAAGVDDPVPEPVPQEPQQDPPAQTLSGDLRAPMDRQAELQGSIGEHSIGEMDKQVPNVPSR
jgi:hypothetical protein